MKKTIITLTILLGLTTTTFADPNGGGLFNRGESMEMGNSRDGIFPMLPTHNETTNQDANETPIGNGIALLATLGAAYLMGKKRREE